MFSLICVGINGWVNNREAGDLRRYRAHYNVIVFFFFKYKFFNENILISMQVSPKFVLKGYYLNQWWLNYRRIYASLRRLNEVIHYDIQISILDPKKSYNW